jgi:hypothetical protein
VIAQQTLRATGLDQQAHELDHSGAVRAAIAKIAHEHQTPALRVMSGRVVSKARQQFAERLDFAMHIADDVDGAVEEFLYQHILYCYHLVATASATAFCGARLRRHLMLHFATSSFPGLPQ